MIKKLQKIFHTDKWWKRVSFFIVFSTFFILLEVLNGSIEGEINIGLRIFIGLIIILFIIYILDTFIEFFIDDNFVQKLQKIFHTDKQWGRVLLSILLYIVYWILFYLIIPFIILVFQSFNFGGVILFFHLLILSPMISFCIPEILLKTFRINRCFLYITHIILIIVPLTVYALLVLLAIRNGFSHMFI